MILTDNTLPPSEPSSTRPSPPPSPPPSSDAGKNVWRAHARAIRRDLAANAVRHAALSHALQNHVLESSCWRGHGTVALYCAVRGEVDTALLIREALAARKRVFLPRCRPDEPGCMDMLACSGLGDLALSSRGIPEPPAHAAALPPELVADTLIIVPALAFDRQGYRLGYGGGYYDRLLASGARAALGLVFSSLLFPRLPRDPWDMPVTALATEEGFVCL